MTARADVSCPSIEKERAIRQCQRECLEAALAQLKVRMDAPTKALRNCSQAERCVGRLFRKYSLAARFFDVGMQRRARPRPQEPRTPYDDPFPARRQLPMGRDVRQ